MTPTPKGRPTTPRTTGRAAAKEAAITTRQFSHATAQYGRGPLTNVGRALTKHPNIIGLKAGTNVAKKIGGAQKVNEAAATALQEIMETGVRSFKSTKRFGNVTDFRLPSGLGARFSAETDEFIGFLGRGL